MNTLFRPIPVCAAVLVATVLGADPAYAQATEQVAPAPNAPAAPSALRRSRPAPGPKRAPTTAPMAGRTTPKPTLLRSTGTAEGEPLPSDVVYDGLPANSVTVRSLVARKKLLKALAVAEMVLRREPRNTEVGMQRARVLYWLKRMKEAEAQATAVYKMDRYNTDALRLVGDIRLQRGDKRGAIRAYREAILRGDPEYDLRLRLIDLYVVIDRPDLAQTLLRPGMDLPDELGWRLAKALYRWQAQAFIAGAAFMGPGGTSYWQRAQLAASYTWNTHITMMGGVYGERRAANRAAGQVFGQLFFNYGRLSGDARLALSPIPSDFLPSIDGWLEGAYNFGKFALGGWARYASFPVAPQLSLGPYAQLMLGRLSLKAGYLLVIRGDFNDPQLDSTIFARARWQFTVQSAVFAWLYYGQESVFTQRRRLLAPDESAVALVLGADRWLNMRWGLRGMVTMVQYLEGSAPFFIELLIAARARF